VRAAVGGARRQVGDVVGGAEEYHDVRVGRQYPAGRLDPAHLRHVDIHQHQLWAEGIYQLDRLEPVRSLARELEAAQPAQHRLGCLPERRLVIDDDHGVRGVHVFSLARDRWPGQGTAHPASGVVSLPRLR
jgi:hypothetical protein